MKQRIGLISVSTLAATSLLLTGCANTNQDEIYVLDSEKVYAVEHAARSSSQNVDIIWVNPPKKRVKKD